MREGKNHLIILRRRIPQGPYKGSSTAARDDGMGRTQEQEISSRLKKRNCYPNLWEFQAPRDGNSSPLSSRVLGREITPDQGLEDLVTGERLHRFVRRPPALPRPPHHRILHPVVPEPNEGNSGGLLGTTNTMAPSRNARATQEEPQAKHTRGDGNKFTAGPRRDGSLPRRIGARDRQTGQSYGSRRTSVAGSRRHSRR